MISQQDVEGTQEAIGALRAEIARVIVGQEQLVDVTLWAVLCGGHLLIEGVPGLGKTLLVRTVSQAMGLSYKRVQCTPDLMPADIVGTNVFLPEEGSFRFLAGPLFANAVLADEVNRATPKTQAALLEAMQERQVTVAGTTHELEPPFVVLATQNPIEMEGTYPLPEAQVDRFLFKAEVFMPDRDEMLEIARRNSGQRPPVVTPVMDHHQVLLAQEVVSSYAVPEPLMNYAVELVLAAHPGRQGAPDVVNEFVQYGPSPRGTLALVWAAKAQAFLDGRYHVTVDDLRKAVRPALVHRLLMNFRGEAEGVTAAEVLKAVGDSVRTP
ncbi:MAG: AAA family ATPase [Candidatus Bipolaricaulota bacterium]